VSKKKKLEKRYKLSGLIICIIIFFASIITILTVNKSIIIDEQTYDIIRKSQELTNKDPLTEKEWDLKSDIFLKPLLKYIDHENAIVILLILIFVLSIFLLYNTLGDNYMFLIIIGISPFLLRTSLIYNEFSLVALFLVAYTFFIIRNSYIISFLLYILIAYINFYLGLFLFLIILYMFVKKKIKFRYVLLFIIPLIFTLSIANNKSPLQINTLRRLFYDFGSPSGIPIVIAILATIGLIIVWNKEPITKYITLTAVIISFLNFETGLFLLNLIGVYLASKLIQYLIKEKWQSVPLKQISISLILCSILFSGAGYASTIIQPDDHTNNIEALNWLNEKTPQESIIFTHHNLGYRTKFFAKRKVLLDGDLSSINLSEQKFNDSIEIFNSRNIDNTKNLLKKYDINYILISQEMKEGLVWNKESEGLLFLMNNNKEFSKIFEDNSTEVWWFSSVEEENNTAENIETG